MDDLINHFDEVIRSLRKEIRGWWIWVTLITVAGAAVIIYGLVFLKSSTTPDLYKTFAGVVLSAFAVFPYKNIPPRRERIATLGFVRTALKTGTISDDDKRQIVMSLTAESLKVTVQRGPSG